LADEECANARRAAAAVALIAERAREPEFARESEAKLIALRDREAQPSGAEQPAAAAALAPAFGTPLGPVLPSMAKSSLFDVYAEGADPLGRRTLEIEAAEPPPNELEILSPELAFNELAVIPRPFRDEENSR
jgi:hypothetical protein